MIEMQYPSIALSPHAAHACGFQPFRLVAVPSLRHQLAWLPDSASS